MIIGQAMARRARLSASHEDAGFSATMLFPVDRRRFRPGRSAGAETF
jgi:hypothetical protein